MDLYDRNFIFFNYLPSSFNLVSKIIWVLNFLNGKLVLGFMTIETSSNVA